MDLAKAYLEMHDRVVEIVQPLRDGQADWAVVACPSWSVRDLVAHPAGGVVDAVTGEAPQFGGELDLDERWTDDLEPVLDILSAHAPPHSPTGSS